MFCLRRFTEDQQGEYKNLRVAEFVRLAEYVYKVILPEAQLNVKHVLYQVYPGERDRTFYNLQENKLLFAFLLCKDGKLVLIGQTRHADQYLYFEVNADKHVACVIVVGDEENEAAQRASETLGETKVSPAKYLK